MLYFLSSVIKGSCTFSGNPLRDNKTVQKGSRNIIDFIAFSLQKKFTIYSDRDKSQTRRIQFAKLSVSDSDAKRDGMGSPTSQRTSRRSHVLNGQAPWSGRSLKCEPTQQERATATWRLRGLSDLRES